jgi:ABC-type uncharacterized transport system fused permease/ATPase subunit
LQEIWFAIGKIFAMYCVMALLQSLTKFMTSALAIQIRKAVGTQIYLSYFSKNNFTALMQDEEFNVGDQQLVQDIDGYCQNFAAVLSGLMVVPIQVIYFWVQVTMYAPLLEFSCFFLLISQFYGLVRAFYRAYVLWSLLYPPKIHHGIHC